MRSARPRRLALNSNITLADISRSEWYDACQAESVWNRLRRIADFNFGRPIKGQPGRTGRLVEEYADVVEALKGAQPRRIFFAPKARQSHKTERIPMAVSEQHDDIASGDRDKVTVRFATAIGD